jgi:hypothetical protein
MKSSVAMWTLFFAIYLGLERFSWKLLFVVSLITIGTVREGLVFGVELGLG